MIKIIITDHSGVLSDDRRPVYEANMMLLQDCGRERITLTQWMELSALTPGGFLRNCGLEVDERETFERYRGYFNELVQRGMHPELIEGVKETLEHLTTERGLRLILLSSHMHVNLVAETAQYGIQRYFEFIIGNAVNKAASLADICHKMGFDRGEVLYVGDTVYDLQAARAAGVLACAVASGYHSYKRLDAEKPDFMLEELSWLQGVF